MKKMEELKEMLCSELDKLAGKGSISKTDLENIHMLTDTIKNLDKIKMLDEQEYSGDGDWIASGRYSRARMSRADGMSNARMSRNDSYADGSYTNDWYIGEGYSRANNSMMHSLEEKMRDPNIPYEEKEILKKAKSILM